MNLTVKKVAKVVKKVEGLSQTTYQCVAEGCDTSGFSPVWAKLTLEAEDPDALKEIVTQAIDAEVDIKFLHPQVTLQSFEYGTKAKIGAEIKNQSLAENIVETFGVEGAKEMVAAAKEIVSGTANGKTYNINIDKPESGGT